MKNSKSIDLIKSISSAYVGMNEAVTEAGVTIDPRQAGIDSHQSDVRAHSQALSQAAHAASKLADHHNTPEWHKHAAALHDLAMGHVGTREGEKAHMDMHTHHFPKAHARPFDATLRNSVMTNEGMTAIVTRKNSDGSYDEVGMSNRSVVRGSHSNILKKAKEYAKGPHRVELFHGDRIGHGAPHKVIHSE
jgi:hypothetical protein